jgi:hypothetical protein
MNPTIYIWSYQEKSMNSNVNEFVINTWKLISTQINESTCHCQTKHVNACPDKTCHCYSRSSMSLLFQTKYVIVIPNQTYHSRLGVIIITDQICHSMSYMSLSFQIKHVILCQTCTCHSRPNMSFQVKYVIILDQTKLLF